MCRDCRLALRKFGTSKATHGVGVGLLLLAVIHDSIPYDEADLDTFAWLLLLLHTHHVCYGIHCRSTGEERKHDDKNLHACQTCSSR